MSVTRQSFRAPLPVILSAWAVPLLVVGQFAMLAVVPVSVLLVGVLRDVRLRALRWWSGALAGVYALPLALWAIGPDRAPSLSKDMHPALAALIVAVSLGVVFAVHVLPRATANPAG